MISKSNAAKPDYMQQRVLGKLKSYTVPYGITEILPYTFYMCGYNNYFLGSSNVPHCEDTVINLPDSITSVGTGAFAGTQRIISSTAATMLHIIPHIPCNLITVSGSAFSNCKFPNNFILPNTVTTLNKQGKVFADVADIPGSIKEMGDQYFSTSTFKTVILRNGIEKLNGRVFEMCSNLTTASLPSSLIYTRTDTLFPFQGCSKLEFVTLEQGFNASIKLNNSTKYSHDTILSWFNALYDRSSTATNTLTMGSTNLAKMSTQEIAIATAKNWTIA